MISAKPIGVCAKAHNHGEQVVAEAYDRMSGLGQTRSSRVARKMAALSR
jgi:hypothetical protein